MTTVWRGVHFNSFVRPESRILVNEFDYKGVNQVIYQENDVTIRSIPAVRALDGPVSFILEWNGFMFAFSSDTYPTRWRCHCRWSG